MDKNTPPGHSIQRLLGFCHGTKRLVFVRLGIDIVWNRHNDVKKGAVESFCNTHCSNPRHVQGGNVSHPLKFGMDSIMYAVIITIFCVIFKRGPLMKNRS